MVADLPNDCLAVLAMLELLTNKGGGFRSPSSQLDCISSGLGQPDEANPPLGGGGEFGVIRNCSGAALAVRPDSLTRSLSLRVAVVCEQKVLIEDGKIARYRLTLKVVFVIAD
jgi:hypothetical protein